jgi:hypothetical protein
MIHRVVTNHNQGDRLVEEKIVDGVRARYFSPDETTRDFVPLRDRIFDAEDGVAESKERIFSDPSWTKVIIAGALFHSDRSGWSAHDPRDELNPLFEVLAEDGVEEIIHMSTFVFPSRKLISREICHLVDAVGTRPRREDVMIRDWDYHALGLVNRLLFDRSGRWGFYGSDEMFGLLGGSPEFMARYVAKAGGWAFIREKADWYWQSVLDYNSYEAPFVSHYYELAGWDNPPVKRSSSSPRR